MINRLYKASGVGLTLASFLLALLAVYLTEPSHWATISTGWSYAGFCTLAGVIAMMFHALLSAHREAEVLARSRTAAILERDSALARPELRLPNLVRTLENTTENTIIVLLEPSILFGTGSAVSVYTFHDSFEVLLGQGRVLAVQQFGGNIQVQIDTIQTGMDEVWQALLKNRDHALKSAFARPGEQAL